MKIIQTLITSAIGTLVFTATTIAQQTSRLSDPEIASVAVVANKIDIDQGQLAQQKSKDQAVLDFAKTMIIDHRSVIKQALALVKKLNVTPKDNALSRQLKADAAKTMNSLRTKSGTTFNRAYINNEVAYHKAVIKAVENVLIPQAQNSELKSLLQNVLPALRTHLEHAQMVQNNMK